MLVKVFVNAPYDRFVTSERRFWHASGIDVALDANGLKLTRSRSPRSPIGGIAFQTPEGRAGRRRAETRVHALWRSRAGDERAGHVRERYAIVFVSRCAGCRRRACGFPRPTVGEVKSSTSIRPR